MRRMRFLVACLAVVALAGSAFAQVPATFVFKSGQRLNGNLVDLGCCDYTISVDGQQRKVGLNDLAVIDFTGAGENFPANEASRVLPGQNLLVLRDGQTFVGKLTDVGGAQPERITFDINGQSRDFSSNEVARIYLDQPPASVAGAGRVGTSGRAGQPASVLVPANQAWTRTGLMVQKGEVVQFASSGQVQLSTNPDDVTSMGGRSEQSAGPRATLPGQPRGALIGRVGNGQPFDVGNRSSITMSESGELYLGVNDDLFTDNTGQYNVTLTPQPGTAGTSGWAEQGHSVIVPANRAWTRTGVTVRQGQVVNFSSSGEVRLSTSPSDVAQPDGRADHHLGVRATLPGSPGGALIGRVENGKPFLIGSQSSVTMPASGELYLGVDDDLFNDNTGQFTVVVTPQGGTTSGR